MNREAAKNSKFIASEEKRTQKKEKDNKYIGKVNGIFEGWKIPNLQDEVRYWDDATREDDIKKIEGLLNSIENLKIPEVRKSIEEIRKLSLIPATEYTPFITTAETWSEAVMKANVPLEEEIESYIKIAVDEEKKKTKETKEKVEKSSWEMKNLSGLKKANDNWKKIDTQLKAIDKFREGNNILRTPETHKKKPDKLYTNAMSLLADATLDAIGEKNLSEWKALVKSFELSEEKKNYEYDGIRPGIKEWMECDTPEQLARLSLPENNAPPWLVTLVQNARMPNIDDEDANHPISIFFLRNDTRSSEDSSSSAAPEIPTLKAPKPFKIQVTSSMVPSTDMSLRVFPDKVANGTFEEWEYDATLAEHASSDSPPNNSAATNTKLHFKPKSKQISRDKAIIFDNSNIISFPESVKNSGGRIVGFSGDRKNILFDVRLVKQNFKEPIFSKPLNCELAEYSSISDWNLQKEPNPKPNPYTLKADFFNRISAGLMEQMYDIYLDDKKISISKEGMEVGNSIINDINKIDLSKLNNYLNIKKKEKKELEDKKESNGILSKQKEIEVLEGQILQATKNLEDKMSELQKAKPNQKGVITVNPKDHSVSIIKIPFSVQPVKK